MGHEASDRPRVNTKIETEVSDMEYQKTSSGHSEGTTGPLSRINFGVQSITPLNAPSSFPAPTNLIFAARHIERVDTPTRLDNSVSTWNKSHGMHSGRGYARDLGGASDSTAPKTTHNYMGGGSDGHKTPKARDGHGRPEGRHGRMAMISSEPNHMVPAKAPWGISARPDSTAGDRVLPHQGQITRYPVGHRCLKH